MSHLPENEIVGTTFFTIDNILSYGKNGPDALALYFKYIEQSRIQMNNQTYSLDVFMIKKMNRGKERFYKSKKIIKELGLIDQIQKKLDNGQIQGNYVRVNFMINQEKVRENCLTYEIQETTLPENHTMVLPDSGKQETNTSIPNINTSIPNINTSIPKTNTLNSEIYFENSKVNELFKQFLEMRIERKKPATLNAIGLLVKKLSRYNDDVKTKMLENSIINQWTDVYELKEQKQYTTPPGMKEGYKYKNQQGGYIGKLLS